MGGFSTYKNPSETHFPSKLGFLELFYFATPPKTIDASMTLHSRVIPHIVKPYFVRPSSPLSPLFSQSHRHHSYPCSALRIACTCYVCYSFPGAPPLSLSRDSFMYVLLSIFVTPITHRGICSFFVCLLHCPCVCSLTPYALLVLPLLCRLISPFIYLCHRTQLKNIQNTNVNTLESV